MKPAQRLGSVRSYAPPLGAGDAGNTVTLRLDVNEGPPPAQELIDDALSGHGPLLAECIRRYPKTVRADGSLEEAACAHYGVSTGELLVTAGGDEALDRVCRAYVEPGRRVVITTPTFEMIPRYIRLSGAMADDLREVPWREGRFPVEAVAEQAAGVESPIVFVVSPNNPTGGAITIDQLRLLAGLLPSGALLVLDLAYEEFADEPLEPAAREIPNGIRIRTLSKAWGLAGLRVGFAMGRTNLLDPLRAAGNPFSVSGISRKIANSALRSDAARASMQETARSARGERPAIARALTSLGARSVPGHANFVLAEFESPEEACSLADHLLASGIAVRRYAPAEPLGACLRITCPYIAADLERLLEAMNRHERIARPDSPETGTPSPAQSPRTSESTSP